MAHQFPNITGQYGVYHTGSPAYVDVADTHTGVDGKIGFPARATADTWVDSDLVGIRISTSGGSKVAVCAWSGVASTLSISATEESIGTIGDGETVLVEAVFTKALLQAALDTVSYDFTPKGGVFVEVTDITFRILEEHNGVTFRVPDGIVDSVRLDLYPGLSETFHCSIIAETDIAVQVNATAGTTLNGANLIKTLPGQYTGAYVYGIAQDTFIMVA